jgi:hypothetical protein
VSGLAGVLAGGLVVTGISCRLGNLSRPAMARYPAPIGVSCMLDGPVELLSQGWHVSAAACNSCRRALGDLSEEERAVLRAVFFLRNKGQVRPRVGQAVGQTVAPMRGLLPARCLALWP